jgi:hypothetical protein
MDDPDLKHIFDRQEFEAEKERLKQGFLSKAYPELKWTPLSRPFFARNKLMLGGVLGLSFGGGCGSPPLAIPALESALGSHPCGALSSVQVPSL